MKKQFFDEKSKKNDLHRKVTSGKYSLPAYHLLPIDEKKFVDSIKREVFHKIKRYGNVVEEQPINKRISTCINYGKVNLERK